MKNNATKTQSSANNAETTVQAGQRQPSMGCVNYLKFTAKVGTVERSLTFPIQKDFEDWLWELDSIYGDPSIEPRESYELEGNSKMKITLSIVNYKRKF